MAKEKTIKDCGGIKQIKIKRLPSKKGKNNAKGK